MRTYIELEPIPAITHKITVNVFSSILNKHLSDGLDSLQAFNKATEDTRKLLFTRDAQLNTLFEGM